MTVRRSIEDLKRYIKQQQEKRENKALNKDVYPFWKMEPGQRARIRILEDANRDNPNIFFLDNLTHKISIGEKHRTIQCLTNYGQKCPICELSRAYYKQEGKDSVNGKYYYRKKSAIARILVLEDPLPPDEEGNTYVGRVVKTYIGYQLINKMLAQMTDEVEPMESKRPWDILEGNDFIIEPIKDGKWNKYDIKSKFISKSTPIPEEYLELVREPVDLSTYLPENPGLEKVEKFLSAHQTGEEIENDDHEPHDEDSYDNATTKVVSKPVERKDELVEEKQNDVEVTQSKNDIMDKIKARFKKTA